MIMVIMLIDSIMNIGSVRQLLSVQITSVNLKVGHIGETYG